MIAALLLLAAPTTLYADGNWAAFDRGTNCAATSRAERITPDRADQAHAGFTFDKGGARHGQLAVRLGHPLRPGGTVMLTIGDQPFLLAASDRFAWSRGPAQEGAIIAAARLADGMRIEGRSPGGGRFVDRYLLAGAPGAIDAAAACSAKR
ncbi:hypothetical protein [Sphingomonas sp.]|uniref:hypothetical protein n=1 Tax=Sphingomonas sp. TaxID=28214 RepID=UPI00286BD024|nr:hypothetical protein [Sphingomonas sp.]